MTNEEFGVALSENRVRGATDGIDHVQGGIADGRDESR
jgi:hypothetical protein